MPRPQFTLKTLLWLMALVAAFFSGWFSGSGAPPALLKRQWQIIDNQQVEIYRLESEIHRLRSSRLDSLGVDE
jgi:hypothetical protein